MKVAELIALLGPAPSIQSTIPTEEAYAEAVRVYREVYAPGLIAFFETAWFLPGSLVPRIFSRYSVVVTQLLSLLKFIEKVGIGNHSVMATAGILETKLVWALACLTFTVPIPAQRPAGLPSLHERNGAEARDRVFVVEALLSGGQLTSNPLTKPPPLPTGLQPKARELEFWYCLGEFVSPRASTQPIDSTLQQLRGLLDGRENRDVLYALAVARTLAPRFSLELEHPVLQHLDEGEPRNQLNVALRFLQSQALPSGGTTNVIRRLCELIVRAYVSPGVNVERRPG